MTTASPPSSLYYVCSQCQKAFAVLEADKEISMLSPIMGCPGSPLCSGKLRVRESVPDGTDLLHTTARALFIMAEGGGLPPERRCGPDLVQAAILGKRITEVGVSQAGSDTNRSIIAYIQVEDGLAVHFAASVLGATVYKMDRKDDGIRNPR